MVANIDLHEDIARGWHNIREQLITVVHGQVDVGLSSLTQQDVVVLRYLADLVERALRARENPLVYGSSPEKERVYTESWCPRCKRDSCEEFWDELINDEEYGFARCCLCGSVYEYYGTEEDSLEQL